MSVSNENDCALMVGRYAEGTLIPSATDETKNIAVGGMQICSINVHNTLQYPCCWTKSGAIENCKSYCSRAAEPLLAADVANASAQDEPEPGYLESLVQHIGERPLRR